MPTRARCRMMLHPIGNVRADGDSGNVVTIELQPNAPDHDDSQVMTIEQDGVVAYTVLLDQQEHILMMSAMAGAEAALREAMPSGRATLDYDPRSDVLQIEWADGDQALVRCWQDVLELFERSDGALTGFRVLSASRHLTPETVAALND